MTSNLKKRKKRIGIDGLSSVQGGGLTYLINLIKFLDNFSEIEVFLFINPDVDRFFQKPNIHTIHCRAASRNVINRTIWEAFVLPRIVEELQIGLVFCPGGSINFHPRSGMLTAVTFQNMLAFDEKEKNNPYLGHWRKLRLALLKGRFKSSFEKADLIIFLSEFAKEIVDLNVPGRCENYRIIPLGLDDTFRTFGRNDLPRLKNIPEGEYILYVSPIFPYKSQLGVVQAYNSLRSSRRTNENLLLVGHVYPRYAEIVKNAIKDYGLEKRVYIMGRMPYEYMPALYHHAKAIVFASKSENCPSIVLESLGSGRLLFLSNRGPMPEIARDAALYFNPEDPDELTELLVRYLDDESISMEFGEKAYKRSLKYEWSTTAKETFKALCSLFE